MQYDFLFDKESHLLAIGYNVDSHRRTQVTTTAGFGSKALHFVAIAQGQLPQESWFCSGRLLTDAGGERSSFHGAVDVE